MHARQFVPSTHTTQTLRFNHDRVFTAKTASVVFGYTAQRTTVYESRINFYRLTSQTSSFAHAKVWDTNAASQFYCSVNVPTAIVDKSTDTYTLWYFAHQKQQYPCHTPNVLYTFQGHQLKKLGKVCSGSIWPHGIKILQPQSLRHKPALSRCIKKPHLKASDKQHQPNPHKQGFCFLTSFWNASMCQPSTQTH